MASGSPSEVRGFCEILGTQLVSSVELKNVWKNEIALLRVEHQVVQPTRLPYTCKIDRCPNPLIVTYCVCLVDSM